MCIAVRRRGIPIIKGYHQRRKNHVIFSNKNKIDMYFEKIAIQFLCVLYELTNGIVNKSRSEIIIFKELDKIVMKDPLLKRVRINKSMRKRLIKFLLSNSYIGTKQAREGGETMCCLTEKGFEKVITCINVEVQDP